MSKNPCCTNNSCAKPPRGGPLSIPQIANAGKSNNRVAQIQKLKSIEDYVFGVHNKSYSASAAKPKKHPHIYRRKDADLLDFANRIKQKQAKLTSMNVFEDIYQEILKIGKQINGIGHLTVFDTTLNYCVNNGIYPDFVYLCASGPLDGAQGYFKQKGITCVEMHDGARKPVSKLRIGDRVKKLNFPDFSQLDCLVIENILCIYHNDLNNITPKIKRISNC